MTPTIAKPRYVEVRTKCRRVAHQILKLYYYYYYYYYYYLLPLSFHSVAVVLTLLINKNKYTRAVHKETEHLK